MLDAFTLAVLGVTALLCAAWLYGAMWRNARHYEQRQVHRVQRLRNYEMALSLAGAGHALELPGDELDLQDFGFAWLRCLQLTAGTLRETFLQSARAAELNQRLVRYRRHDDPDLRYLAWSVAAQCEDRALLLRQLPRLRWPVGREVAFALVTDANEQVSLQALQWALQQNAPVADISSMVRICRHEHQETLERLLRELEPKSAAKLLEAWGSAHVSKLQALVHSILRNPENDGWLLCAALRLLTGASEMHLVLPYLHDKRWSVRLAAVRATGWHGFGAHLEALHPHAHSKHYWIRKRARQSLNLELEDA